MRLKLLCACILMWLTTAGAPAAAHDLPYSFAEISVSKSGAYRVALRCHVAALLVGFPQKHLPPEAQVQFLALSAQDIGERADIMSAYFKQTFEMQVDGLPIRAGKLSFPDIAAIREDARQTLETQAPSEPITISGQLPVGAQEVAVTFPPELGTVVVRWMPPAGKPSMQALTPAERSNPFLLRTDGTSARQQVAVQYLQLGAIHILGGFDHLLFVLGLLLLVKSRRSLFLSVTAFTVAHSITLAIATLGHVTPARDVVDMAIAISIAFLGVEAILARRGITGPTIRWPGVTVFIFGLAHGFGIAGGLTALGLPQNELPFALALFNIGVELGQLAFIATALGLLRAFRLMEIRWWRVVKATPAYSIMISGFYWLISIGASVAR